MTPEEVDVSIKWPFKWCLVGSSGSGKTQFSLDVIANAFRLFDTPPSKIIIVYKEFQDIYTKFNEYIPTTLYKEDDIDLEEITKSNREKLLIICDDLYFSKKINEVAEQFLVKGRHRNTSWIVLTQSIFNHCDTKEFLFAHLGLQNPTAIRKAILKMYMHNRSEQRSFTFHSFISNKLNF